MTNHSGREPILPGPVNTALATLKSSVEVENLDLYAQNLEKRILKAFKNNDGKIEEKTR